MLDRRLRTNRTTYQSIVLLAAALLAPVLVSCGGSGSADEIALTSSASAPSVAGCPVFPSDNAWNRDVSAAPVDPASDALIAGMSPGDALGLALGISEEYYGGRYVIVSPEQPLVNIEFQSGGENYDAESDHGPFPIPLDAPIQGGSQSDPNPTSGDRHVIVVQSGTCQLFELYNTERVAGGFRVSSSARWDLRTNARRPRGWTSADGAGLPIFPGLLRWEEVAAGEIRHALRFTVPRARKAFVDPANHCGPEDDPSLPPYGTRVRLKASFDATPYSGPTRVILEALKRYGLILADQGAAWQVSGVTNAGFEGPLRELRSMPIHGAAFEVVELGTIQSC